MDRIDSHEAHRRARVMRARLVRQLVAKGLRALREAFRAREPRLAAWRTIG
jgi:hypothetical protein